MKRLTVLAVILALLFGSALAAPETIDLDAMTLEQLEQLQQRIKNQIDAVRLAQTVIGEDYLQFRTAAVRLSGAEFVESGNKKYIVLSFDWTNTSTDPQNFMLVADVTASQGGIGLDTGILWDVKTESLTQVQPGISFSSKAIFALRDASPVTVTVDSCFDFADQYQDAKYTFAP